MLLLLFKITHTFLNISKHTHTKHNYNQPVCYDEVLSVRLQYIHAVIELDKLSPFFVLYCIREQEDGAKVVRVENMDNPYKHQDNFDKRFKLSLNKLYAWSLVDYDRVVMLDADNLFLQKTDELFQCGQFCAVFINPCVFHTGLFVLQVILA